MAKQLHQQYSGETFKHFQFDVYFLGITHSVSSMKHINNSVEILQVLPAKEIHNNKGNPTTLYFRVHRHKCHIDKYHVFLYLYD